VRGARPNDDATSSVGQDHASPDEFLDDTEATGYDAHCFATERVSILTMVAVAAALYTAWIPVDFLLEPRWARTFLVVRVVYVFFSFALGVVLRRAKSLRLVRAAFVMLGLGAGSGIAAMLPYVEHYTL